MFQPPKYTEKCNHVTFFKSNLLIVFVTLIVLYDLLSTGLGEFGSSKKKRSFYYGKTVTTV